MKLKYKWYEIGLLVFELLFTLLVYRATIFRLVDDSTNQKNLFYLVSCFWIINLTVQYARLKVKIVYISWLFISLLHLLLYFILTLKNYDYNNKILILPIVQIVLYQIFRILSLKFFKLELELPSKHTKDVISGYRNATIIDRISFVFGLLLFILFNLISSK